MLGITGMRASFHALADEDFISTDDGFDDDDADDFDHIPEGESDVFDRASDDDDGDQDIGTRGIHLAGGRRAVSPHASATAAHPSPRWKVILDNARRDMKHAPPVSPATDPVWPHDRRIVYIVDMIASYSTIGIPIELATEQRDRNGGWKPPVQFRYPEVWHLYPDPTDRLIAQMLLGALPSDSYRAEPRATRFLLSGAAIETTLRLICETGRCRARMVKGERPVSSVHWDDGHPWKFHLRLERTGTDCTLAGGLRRDKEEMSLAAPLILHSQGVLISGSSLARFDHGGAWSLVAALRSAAPVRVEEGELPALLESLFTLPQRPEVDLPSGTEVSEVGDAPIAGVAVHAGQRLWGGPLHHVEPFFIYGDVRVPAGDGAAAVFDRNTLTVRRRDPAFEATSMARIRALGARDQWDYSQRQMRLSISQKKAGPLVYDLVSAGWHVEADGAVYRTSASPWATVRSGVDWFDLDAGVKFGDIDVSLGDLLDARKTHGTTIVLSDGSRGLLPLDWLARLGPLLAGGTAVNGALRYARSQTALLDALLATIPEADVDATFERARIGLRTFAEVAPRDPPRTFRGTLREYQRDGLGWLHFLREFGLGGCLADDMGLGKTVQVLALLDSRRGTPKRPARPSIVVVPRSLVFNWFREAERFAPRLRMLDHTGIGRDVSAITSGDVDVVVTTYGTLRRDAAGLAAIEFDYVILDEAQAIKTAGSASAKAARLLRAEHRLAMTGTPIENRLEELWSLFEFLNPGMFGTASSFGRLARLGGARDETPANREVLARALRPVILRRTKQQVASDLPERIEQTLSVDLEGSQRKFYDDLLEAYRRSVLEKVDRVGIGKSRMHILEALLRLRQAACHPVLADPRKASAPSAKLDALLPAMEQVIEEGHKALVFSQFTSFLALLRERLDREGVRYEYLDGSTRNRQERVDRFQADASCPLFLISLKAGGHGLNLTAADYVFILDPWWNPAVEAQAIDRAHRIGQSRRVIATRIVARNTIETKILALQDSKRALAEAILGQDQGVLAGIGRAELEMLLA